MKMFAVMSNESCGSLMYLLLKIVLLDLFSQSYFVDTSYVTLTDTYFIELLLKILSF